jgi:ADP-ribosylglycohydrolase
MRRDADYYEGCLLGGALGDALGAPVEFINYQQILHRYGAGGIQRPQEEESGLFEITDDTQMTLFTAEGLLRARTAQAASADVNISAIVHHAYLRWLHTQGENNPHFSDYGYHTDDGFLIQQFELFNQRAPGLTCTASLMGPHIGTVQQVLNDSKGCGAVMRAAPVGMIDLGVDPFALSCEIAALTHGHIDGILPAGVLAQIIHEILAGRELEEAVQYSLQVLSRHKGHEGLLARITEAVELAHSGLPVVTCYKRLGRGWVGDEALAIAVYCALKSPSDFRQGVILAVNHDGDSDSTGSICGNILGAYLGRSALPQDWLAKLELREVIAEVGRDLLTAYRDDEEWKAKYPGW